MKFSLIIPCYNEGENIPLLIDRLKVVFKNKEYEVILVNNGSKDNTQKIIEESIKGLKNFKVLRILENIGYGNGILRGLELSKGKIIGWTHADMQTDPKDAIKALKFFENSSKKD